MKRVKVMLMSLVLFAVVGGALAFKAKFLTQYCTTTPRQAGGQFFCDDGAGNNLTCTQGVINSTTTSGSGTGIIRACTTPTVNVGNPCPGNECPTLVRLKVNVD